MQVVILAGGLGTRLRPVTQHVPKPMVEVAGRPFLEYIITHLAQQGFNRILILLGYLGEQIKEYFGNGNRWGVAIEYASEPKPLGTAGAILNAVAKLDPEFMLLYGDSYLPIDYKKVMERFHEVALPCLMVVYDNRLSDTGVMNNVALDCGLVHRYEKGRPAGDLRYVEAGVLCLRRSIFEKLTPSGPISLEQDLYGPLIADRQAGAFVTSQRFFDIGTPERLEEFAANRR